jgi:hypothetical protein
MKGPVISRGTISPTFFASDDLPVVLGMAFWVDFDDEASLENNTGEQS